MNGPTREIVVQAGQQRAETLLLKHQAEQSPPMGLRIVLEPDSKLDLEELHQGQGNFNSELLIEVTLDRGAEMRHVAVVEDQGKGSFGIDRRICLAEAARMDYTRVGSGAGVDRETLRAELVGPRARFTHGHLMMLDGRRRADLDLEIAHRARKAESDSRSHCILGAESHGRFAGRIFISTQGQGTDARLRNDNLLLDESARMETRPELEVYADEVQCAHGAATGALDEDALFYLRTRGLPPHQARAMLVRAFASKISGGIALPGAQRAADELLNRTLDGLASDRLAA